MSEFDVASLSTEDFAALEDWQLKQALQQCAGYMAVAQAAMRENSDGFHGYLAAKEEFSRFRQLSSILQTIIRTA